jgi:hypothetical protein
MTTLYMCSVSRLYPNTVQTVGMLKMSVYLKRTLYQNVLHLNFGIQITETFDSCAVCNHNIQKNNPI